MVAPWRHMIKTQVSTPIGTFDATMVFYRTRFGGAMVTVKQRNNLILVTGANGFPVFNDSFT